MAEHLACSATCSMRSRCCSRVPLRSDRSPSSTRSWAYRGGFDRCVNLAQNSLALTLEEAGTLRAIDTLRDIEQHWHGAMSEGLLYVHTRAGTTLFDDLLLRWFDERLLDHLPHRVLPISAEAPKDIQLLIDEEYSQVADLLKPQRRRGPEAAAKIRSLLALEAHTADEVFVSQRDVERVTRGIRDNGPGRTCCRGSATLPARWRARA